MCKTIKRLLYLAIMLFVVTPTNAFAQIRTIQGHVVDTNDEPMAGVYVMVKGTTTGVVTDIDGKFEMKAKTGSTLVFSFIGFTDKTVVVGKARNILVKMSQNAEQMEELVVVGYGQQKRESVVGAITQTKGEDLVKTGGVNTVSEALQGLMAGVTAINSTSKPGADNASLLIRGKASWNNSTPLYLVDGVERNFNDIDINEIASISVLKDASATAVYGVKGANGVILITTKKGSDSAPVVNFTTNIGFKNLTTDFDWLDYNKSQKLYNEAVANDQLWDKTIPESTLKAWDQAYATGNYGPYNDYFPDVDWYDLMVKDMSVSQQYNLNVKGGNKKLTYFASIGFLNDGDIYNIKKQSEFDPRYWYKRYNWRTNLDYKLTKTTNISVKIAGKMGYQNQPAYRTDTGSKDNLLSGDSNLFPIQYDDGMFGADVQGGGNAYMKANYYGQRQTDSFQGFYDLAINQKLDFITKGLSFKAKLSYTSYSNRSSKIIKSLTYGQSDSETEKSFKLRAYRVMVGIYITKLNLIIIENLKNIQ